MPSWLDGGWNAEGFVRYTDSSSTSKALTLNSEERERSIFPGALALLDGVMSLIAESVVLAHADNPMLIIPFAGDGRRVRVNDVDRIGEDQRGPLHEDRWLRLLRGGRIMRLFLDSLVHGGPRCTSLRDPSTMPGATCAYSSVTSPDEAAQRLHGCKHAVEMGDVDARLRASGYGRAV